MIQFYFLSILLNVLSGMALLSAAEAPEKEYSGGTRAFLLSAPFSLAVGILSIATGIFKLLTPVSGDVPVIGDLFPALSGLSGGFSLLLGYYCAKSDVASKTMERLKRIFLEKRKVLGIIAITAGVLHFIFPGVVLL
jgi:hypothetical protein